MPYVELITELNIFIGPRIHSITNLVKSHLWHQTHGKKSRIVLAYILYRRVCQIGRWMIEFQSVLSQQVLFTSIGSQEEVWSSIELSSLSQLRGGDRRLIHSTLLLARRLLLYRTQQLYLDHQLMDMQSLVMERDIGQPQFFSFWGFCLKTLKTHEDEERLKIMTKINHIVKLLL